MSGATRVPLTAVKTLSGGSARRGGSAFHPAQPVKAPNPPAPLIESSDPLQAGISVAEREERLKAYQHGANAFTVAEFARLVRGSTSSLYAARQSGALKMTLAGKRKWIISIADTAAYLNGGALR